MARIHNLGFPRIGAQRELKFAQEKHWQGALSHAELEALGAELRQQNWRRQSALDWVPVGDFSFYDQVLDTSFLLGNLPVRARLGRGQPLDAYFRVARGRAAGDSDGGVAAGERRSGSIPTITTSCPSSRRKRRFASTAVGYSRN